MFDQTYCELMTILYDTRAEHATVTSTAKRPISGTSLDSKSPTLQLFWVCHIVYTAHSTVNLLKTLEKAPSTPRGYRMTLFSTGRDSSKEKWDGARTDLASAAEIFRADDAFSISSLSSHLRSTLSVHENVFVDVPPSHNRRSTRAASNSKSVLKYLTPSASGAEKGKIMTDYDAIVEGLNSSKRKPLAPILARLRAVKSRREVAVMRAAADLSGRAHAKVCVILFLFRPGVLNDNIHRQCVLRALV
jgi:Xaa-Pro aminopeptidase